MRIGARAVAAVVAVLPLLPGCRDSAREAPARDAIRARQEKKEKELLYRLARNPADVNARRTLADLYYDTDRPHRAIPAYLEVLKHRPDDPDVRTDLGTCYKRVNQLEKARAEYRRVLEKHPRKLQALFNLAIVSEMLEDWESAARLWERVAAVAPGTRDGEKARRYAVAARQRLEARKKRSTVPGGPAGR